MLMTRSVRKKSVPCSAAKGTPGACDEILAAASRDAAEMRALWFMLFGREP